jgi:hypothetical protein
VPEPYKVSSWYIECGRLLPFSFVSDHVPFHADWQDLKGNTVRVKTIAEDAFRQSGIKLSQFILKHHIGNNFKENNKLFCFITGNAFGNTLINQRVAK